MQDVSAIAGADGGDVTTSDGLDSAAGTKQATKVWRVVSITGEGVHFFLKNFVTKLRPHICVFMSLSAVLM